MNQMMSPEQFVAHFAPALQEYLEYQYSKEGHILDMTAASGEFFTVSFHSIHAAMDALRYTEPTSLEEDVPSEEVK